MLKEFEYWIKTPDNLRTLYFLKRLIRAAAASRVWDHPPLRWLRDYLRSWAYVNYHIISVDPLILVDVWQHRYFRELSSLLPQDQNIYFICLNWWHLESETNVRLTAEKYHSDQRRFPRHKIISLCNSLRQKQLFDQFGLPNIFCNQNALLDENRYRILPAIEKKYDAIYLGVAAPFKRHWLARDVESLALITHFAAFSKTDYVQNIRAVLKHAHWLAAPEPLKNYIPGACMAEYLNQARVGLCLSAAEGAMYASAEYLLCGLPVVSTRSRGGRDVFFDPDYVKIVDDDPAAVRRAVRELMDRRTPPEEIRRRTLTKMQPHRDRFVRLIQDIYDQEGAERKFQTEWNRVFVNKMIMSRRQRCLCRDIKDRRRALASENRISHEDKS